VNLNKDLKWQESMWVVIQTKQVLYATFFEPGTAEAYATGLQVKAVNKKVSIHYANYHLTLSLSSRRGECKLFILSV
jgi:hypothetical protein